MDGKETAKKIWKKTGFGILFVAACFIAMFILIEFHGDILMVSIAAALLLIAAFLFLNAVFSDKAKKWAPEEEKMKEEKEVLPTGGDGEFRLKITKHMKEMENIQKELIDILKNQNTLIQTQIENLEHEIYMLSEKQENQTKSIIKFNKENARQLAISERETLEYVMTELKKAIEDNAGPAVVREMDAELPVAAEETVMEELTGEELFEVSDLPGDEEFVMPDLPGEEEFVMPELSTQEEPSEEIEIPDMPDDIDLSELFDIPELLDEPVLETTPEEKSLPEEIEENAMIEEVVAEDSTIADKKEEESVPAPDPLAGLGADPNAMMTPEDIAKLLEAMGQ